MRRFIRLIVKLIPTSWLNSMLFAFYQEADGRRDRVWLQQIEAVLSQDPDSDIAFILGDRKHNGQHYILEEMSNAELVHELAESIRYRNFLEEQISSVYCEFTRTLSYPHYQAEAVLDRMNERLLDGAEDAAKAAVQQYHLTVAAQFKTMIDPVIAAITESS